MAPAARPRGRPKKTRHTFPSSTARSTATVTRRSKLQFDSVIPNTSGPSTLHSDDHDNNDGKGDEDWSDYTLDSMHDKYSARKKNSVAQESLPSPTTSNDYNESSGYSTPPTSSFTTPAPTTKFARGAASTSQRSRRAAATTTDQHTPRVNAIERVAALRNNQFALGSLTNKRKRSAIDDDDDLDVDNSRDAQVARALQEEEDAANPHAWRRSRESALRRIAPKTRKRPFKTDDFVNSDEDSDDDFNDLTAAKPSLKPKVELGSKGSNAVSFPSKSLNRKPFSVADSEEDSDAFVLNISSDEDDEPIVTKTISRFQKKKVIKQQSEEFKTQKSSSSARNRGSKFGAKSFSKLTTASNSDDPEASNSSVLPEPIESDSDSNASVTDSDDDSNTGSESNETSGEKRARSERAKLELQHPELLTMWQELANLPKIGHVTIEQPKNITRILKPFQLEGVAWMKAMEDTDWGGGLLGDEMGMGKTIQAVSLIMSDWPAKQPSLVLIPPVALMQWQQEIAAYTDGTLKTFVFHGTNAQTKGVTVRELKKYDVILISYNSLESMYRKQEKGFKRKDGLFKEKSIIHQLRFHRVILDEAHNIKQRTSGSAKACFALKADHKWCLSGTPLQNRIGEFFSLIRFLDIRPFACYLCKQCKCSGPHWNMDTAGRCIHCKHTGVQHVSVFNQELLNPIQKHGNYGPGRDAFWKLRILTDRFMLRRVKRDQSSAMELPAKEIYVDRQFFGEEENDFANSIMDSGNRRFETYVAQGVLLNNYANIFGLIMQMRQVADHPDLILKKNGEGGQNVIICCICDETAEEAIRSGCKHDFCRECAKNYLRSSDQPDCPTCHIPLAIDLEQPDIEQDNQMVKKSSIINRIKMENWTSSSKIETLVHDLHELRSKKMSTKSIIFSQFTTMLQLVEWRLRRAGITTVMLDGSMTPAQRQASINHFMTDVNVECFLVSLKAGGVALNLTEASKVFIIDPWWNPAAEWQSADRCHRIGQTRPCSITRLCIEDSVESRMVLLQEKKANMIHSTINADAAAMESLTSDDMQFLFRGN